MCWENEWWEWKYVLCEFSPASSKQTIRHIAVIFDPTGRVNKMFPQKAIIMNGIVIQQTADGLLEPIILQITNYCRCPPDTAASIKFSKIHSSRGRIVRHHGGTRPHWLRRRSVGTLSITRYFCSNLVFSSNNANGILIPETDFDRLGQERPLLCYVKLSDMCLYMWRRDLDLIGWIKFLLNSEIMKERS